MRSAPSSTLVRHWLPERSLASDAGLVLAFSLFTGLMAHIAIPLPFTPVPITGQTFAVLLCGAAHVLTKNRRHALADVSSFNGVSIPPICVYCATSWYSN